MKERSSIILIILCVLTMLSGCAAVEGIFYPLPEAYTDGVKIPKGYPHDILEIYDDAVVFDKEDDGSEIKIEYGTQDDVDDVIDFHMDLFEDKELAMEETDESRDELRASGWGSNFYFEIKVDEAKGGYEERAFNTVVKVTVEFIEEDFDDDEYKDNNIDKGQEENDDADDEIDNPVVYENTLIQIEGFWHQCGEMWETGRYFKTFGYAYEIEGMNITYYENFEVVFEDKPFTFVDENTIMFKLNGTERMLMIEFVIIDGFEFLFLYDDYNNMELFYTASSYDEMMAYKGLRERYNETIYLEDELSDDELRFYLTETNWYTLYRYHPDGTYESLDYMERIYFWEDGTGLIEHYDGTLTEITWNINNEYLVIYFYNGTSITYIVDYSTTELYPYLYIFGDRDGRNGAATVYKPPGI